MAAAKFNMDLLNPLINSEVPGPQTLREAQTVVPGPQILKEGQSEVPGPQTLREGQSDVPGPQIRREVQTEAPGPQTLREGQTEVPGPQTLREAQTEVPGPQTHREATEETLTPVLKTTKCETAFSKKDGVKLQKVEPKNVYQVINIAYNQIESEVISGPHPLRVEENGVQKCKDIHKDTDVYKEKVVHKDKDVPERKDGPDDKKARTKIPVLRFKQAVDKVTDHKKLTQEDEKNTSHEVPQRQLSRRSSIPKLQKVDHTVSSKAKPSLGERNGSEQEKISKPEDEFDKIYDEIVENKYEDIVKIKTKNDDVKIESKFEEIIHDYEEPVLKHVDAVLDEIISKNYVLDEEKVVSDFEEIIHTYEDSPMEKEIEEEIKKEIPVKRTKIPLLKGRSQDNIKVNRRHSLKNSLSDEGLVKNKSIDYGSSKNGQTLGNNATNHLPREKTINNIPQLTPNIDNTKISVKNLKPTPREDSHKVIMIDIPIDQIEKDDIITDRYEPKIIEISNKDKFVDTPIIENNIETKAKTITDENDDNDLPSLRGKVNRWINKIRFPNDEEPLKLENPEKEIQKRPKNHSVKVKSTDHESTKNEQILGNNVTNAPREEGTINNVPQPTPNIDNTEIPVQDRGPMLKEDPNKVIMIETPDDQIAKDDIIAEKFDPKITEIINKDKLEDTPIKYGESNVETKAKTITDKNEHYLPLIRGKVSLLINKIRSANDEKPLEVEKSENLIQEIPKKKSVSSRIAMFEQKHPESIVRPKTQPETVTATKSKDFEPKRPESTMQSQQTHSENMTLNIEELPISQVVTDEIKLNRKPKVVEQVLIQAIRQEPEDNKESIISDKTADDVKEVKSNDETVEVVKVINNADEQIALKDNSVKYERIVIEPTVEPSFIVKETKTSPIKPNDTKKEENDKKQQESEERSSPKYERKVSGSIIERRIKRLTSKSETDLYKSQMSIVDIELGGVVRGKVHNILENMKTVEKYDHNKTEVINAKERPRKRSVSDKIALFERKLTPIDMEHKLETNHMNKTKSISVSENPKENKTKTYITVSENAQEDYSTAIEELVSARRKYGAVGEVVMMELNDGVRMPAVAVGTALLEPQLARYIVEAAIDLGYRAIDTAYIYGNEREVGEAIRNKIEDGTVKRSELFISSKLWSTFHRPDLVAAACRSSLDTMQLQYFDLYMIHNPMSFKEDGPPVPTIANVLQYSMYTYLDAWRAMPSLVHSGLTRSIGVSNFNSSQLARCIEKGHLAPSVNQVECHPYLNQDRLSTYCNNHGITVSCYGTLGSKGTPLGLKSHGAAAEVDDPRVRKMAAELGVSAAQVLISYQLSRGHAVVVKASSAAHLRDNLRAQSLALDDEMMRTLAAMNRNKRNFVFKGMGDTHREYPFNSAI